jgi:small nuclear ribonucleoprotein (snRNP)-like protein
MDEFESDTSEGGEEEGLDLPQRDDRRGPPPEFTGAEAAYLNRNKEARTPMVVRLSDGEMVRGVIEYYDRDMVKINRTEGPNLFIRKSQIRYMHREG